MRSIDEVNCELKAITNLKDKLEQEKREIENANYKPTLKEAIDWIRYRREGSKKDFILVERSEGTYTVEKSYYKNQNCVVTLPNVEYIDGLTEKDFGCPIDGLRVMANRQICVYFRTPAGMDEYGR